jgi:hypothetical protein
LAFNKTIIAPNIGCLSEETGKSNIHLFNDQNELKEMIKLHISEIGKNDKA